MECRGGSEIPPPARRGAGDEAQIRRLRWGALGAFALVALLTLSAPLGTASPATDARGALLISPVTHGTLPGANSKNWAGYVITSTRGTVTSVTASWYEPAFVGACRSSEHTVASIWVGLDGWSSNTSERTGTDLSCSAGVVSYSAWFEFYPATAVRIPLDVRAGDLVSAYSQEYASKGGSTYQITLLDECQVYGCRNGGSFQALKVLTTPVRTSAEWVVESRTSAGKTLPLADFGQVVFRSCETQISGKTRPIGDFPGAYHRLDSVNGAGTGYEAVTRGLTHDITRFRVAWESSGP